jgi:mannose-1-phosphate guanylyltransferase
MAGGQGTRFWPWSIKDKPKQFLPLVSEETMLQQTVNRFRKWLPPEKVFIITTKEYITLVKEQLPSMNDNQIIIEPFPRDTAPCIALTALHFLNESDNEVFAAIPADHYIYDDDDSDLYKVFNVAESIAENEHSIVTLGIKPTRPEMGYGYIQAEKFEDNDKVLRVNTFIEKPCKEKAEMLYKEENVYWNSGIFFWKPTTVRYYMQKFQPMMWERLSDAQQNLEFQYSLVPKISVDYAILEKAETIYSLPINLQWDDVGNWSAWERLHKESNEENFIRGDIHSLSTKNCLIKSEDKTAVVIGVEDLIIVSTKEGLLVCHKSLEQKIKDLI